MSNILEADNFEELAELAVGFLEGELNGERTVVVHGDDQHASAVVQLFSGFSLKQAERLDAIEWQWQDRVSQAGRVVVEPPDGMGKRAIMAAPFRRANRAASGFLYVERGAAFSDDEQRQMQAFADEYLDALWKFSPAIRKAYGDAQAQPIIKTEDPNEVLLKHTVAFTLTDAPRRPAPSSQTVAVQIHEPIEEENLEETAAWEIHRPAAAPTPPPSTLIQPGEGSPWAQFQGRDLEMMLVDWY